MKIASALIRNGRTLSSWLQTDTKNFQVTKFSLVNLLAIQSSLIKFCQYDVILHPVLNDTRNEMMS